jgi:hypothetical protein
VSINIKKRRQNHDGRPSSTPSEHTTKYQSSTTSTSHKTSDRLKKDYAVKRKHLMQFVRDSAKEDLIALEESALILEKLDSTPPCMPSNSKKTTLSDI